MTGVQTCALPIFAVYTSAIGVKNIRFVLAAALIADFVGMVTSAIVWNII